ncbi:phosphotransferase [Novipirellula aureliae]|nr:phosphotransferase [Novipirellula aureliae]
MPPGFSGADVFRVTDSIGKTFALKRYSVGTTIDRINSIHRFLSAVYHNDCQLVPRVCPVLNANDTVVWDGLRGWELVTWVSGSPIKMTTNHRVLLDGLSKGAAAIANVHRASHSLGIHQQPAAAVGVRLKRADEISKLLDQLICEGRANVFSDSLSAKIDSELTQSLLTAIDFLAKRWQSITKSISESLRPFANMRLSNQHVIRDVHREHIFFDHDGISGVSGIIDFDAIRVDSPATDLSRWTTSFVSSGIQLSELWNSAFAGYRQEWGLGEHEESLARHLTLASAWISLANWVIWVALQRRSFPVEPNRVAARINECLKTVEFLE